MRGRILIEKKGERRWLYLPEVHIQLFIARASDNKWIVAAFRTDGLYGKTHENAVPTIQHLQNDFHWGPEFEVPDHIGHFAAESNRRRVESVNEFERLLRMAVEARDVQGGWRTIQAQMAAEELEAKEAGQDEDSESLIGEEISKLMAQAGGLN